jgi:hypothetical protein
MKLVTIVVPVFVIAPPAFAAPFHSLPLARRGDPFPIPGIPKATVPKIQSDYSFAGLEAHPWIPASLVANASRSPCPLLNTLANHGILCVSLSSPVTIKGHN